MPVLHCRTPVIAALILCALQAPAAAQDASEPSPDQTAELTEPAQTAEPAQTDEPAAGWGRACDETGCHISRTLTESGSNRRILAFTVVVLPDRGGGRLVTLTPLGIDIRAGVWIKGSRDVRRMPVETCLQEGCLAALPVDPTSLDLIASQTSLTFEFLPYRSEQSVEIEMPIDGLAEAIAAVEGG